MSNKRCEIRMYYFFLCHYNSIHFLCFMKYYWYVIWNIWVSSLLIFSCCHNKCHRLDNLNNRHLSSHSSGGQESMIRVPVGLISCGASFSGWQVAVFSLCVHMTCPLCGRKRSLASFPLFIRIPALFNQDFTIMSLFNLNYLFKGSISTHSYIEYYGFHIWIVCGRAIIQPIYLLTM